VGSVYFIDSFRAKVVNMTQLKILKSGGGTAYFAEKTNGSCTQAKLVTNSRPTYTAPEQRAKNRRPE
jgi:hypothetical protein